MNIDLSLEKRSISNILINSDRRHSGFICDVNIHELLIIVWDISFFDVGLLNKGLFQEVYKQSTSSCVDYFVLFVDPFRQQISRTCPNVRIFVYRLGRALRYINIKL